ncbi:amidohydrolase [Jannaschia sp. 2305UL9-9]|uniref:amidohydrolase family protein n=1 Tax=Jannaschia sp. 2305UL9-9 TaxID=3121638 RepID=UPI003529C336
MSLPQAAAPTATPTPPKAILPPGACDTHVHMLGSEFALSPTRAEEPAEGTLEEWAQRLERHLEVHGLDRVVIVHTILYGADNAVTLAAIKRMGDRARGIALVRDDVSDAQLDALHAAGVRGVRLNFIHGGILTWEGAKAMAPRLAERGMHIQMLMNTHLHMVDLAPDVRALPLPIVFDHNGWPDVAAGVAEPGFEVLRQLVADGAAHVKLSGLNRVCDAPFDAVAGHVEALARANPQACVWASDWPHIMLGTAQNPDTGVMLNAFLDVVTSEADRKTILTDVPERLYGF